MKLFAFVKSAFKSIIKNFLPLIFTFSIFPIILGLVTGYFNEDMFVPSADMPVMAISIIDRDNSEESKNLIAFLESDEMKKLVETRDEEEGEYIITIPSGYGDSFLGNENIPIKIDVTDKGSTRQGSVLAEIIDKFNEEMYLGLCIQENIERKFNLEEKETLYQKIYGKFSNIYGNDLIENVIVTTKKSLTSYEHFSITFLSYMLFMVISSLTNGEYVVRENDLYSRIMAAPITETQYFNYNLVSSYLFVLLFNLLYVFAYRILGLSFTGSFTLLLMILIVQSLLGTMLSALLSLFLNKRIAIGVLNILIIVQLISGVTYRSLSKIGNGMLANMIDRYSPDALIVNTYKNYLIYGDFNSIKTGLLSMFLVSIIIYAISLFGFKRKRGVAW